MNCPFCSELLADGSQFCTKCGKPLAGYAALPVPAGPPQTSGKAIGSLICGLFAWLFPISLGAVVLGHWALSEIRQSAGRLKGQGLATAGLVLGYMGIAFIPFLLIIAAIAIPNLLRARMAANEASAVGSMRTYVTAIIAYAEQCPKQGYPNSAVKLGPGGGDCEHANLVDDTLGTDAAVKSGYVFHFQPGATDEQGRIVSYQLTADPVKQDNTGSRHFFVDETGVIRVDKAGPASTESPAIH